MVDTLYIRGHVPQAWPKGIPSNIRRPSAKPKGGLGPPGSSSDAAAQREHVQRSSAHLAEGFAKLRKLKRSDTGGTQKGGVGVKKDPLRFNIPPPLAGAQLLSSAGKGKRDCRLFGGRGRVCPTIASTGRRCFQAYPVGQGFNSLSLPQNSRILNSKSSTTPGFESFCRIPKK